MEGLNMPVVCECGFSTMNAKKAVEHANKHEKESTMEYTKGEWKVRSGDFETVMCGDKVIATVPWTNAKANAYLIAAAPLLYEACDLVQRAWVGDGVEMAVAVDACLLALAKYEDGIYRRTV